MELRSYNLAELAPPDIQAYLAEKDIVMVPIASMEQHGPHLPLATDTIQADEITRRAAERAQVLYTPCVWMGYSPQHMYAPGAGTGTITVRSQVLLELWYHDEDSVLAQLEAESDEAESRVRSLDALTRKVGGKTGTTR